MEDFKTFHVPILSMIELLERQLSIVKTFAKEETSQSESESESEIVIFAKKQQQRRKCLTSLIVENLEYEIELWREELQKVRMDDEDVFDQLLGGNEELFKKNMKVLLEDEKIDISGIDLNSDKDE